MNHIYRSIWNASIGSFVAVSENTKNSGKGASSGGLVKAGFALKALAGSLLMAFGSHAYALPVNGVVSAGTATLTASPGNMTVNQTSQNVALNWQSFNIAKGEAVTFVQPNSSSVALNRVVGADPSSILGNLSANGKVFLINPNGILFGQGASVNVGGLVASTLDISDSDFMAGRYKFAGSSSGTVLNQGNINADGGYVALLGAHVSNQGTIAARLGTVVLAAGTAITLDVAGDGFLNVTVDQGALNALVENGGMIQADGGHVMLSAQAAGDLLHTAVNNTGIIQAQTIDEHNGTIRLLGDMQSGTVNAGGTLDASAPHGGDGGFIETSAAHVKIADDTKVTTTAPYGLTGSWLIDPTDYTIAASGGDITGATLSANLAGTDITIRSTSGTTGTAGDVNVNDVVSWSANKLTLNAQNNINIRANLNASATASLALEFGQNAVAANNTSNIITTGASVNLPASTTNFTTKQGSNGTVKHYTVITSLGAAGSTTTTDLQGMSGNTGINYVLGSDIDASATAGWNSGAGFNPVGTMSSRYTGTFDGLGHTISGLTINRSSEDFIGLFGAIGSSGVVRNVGLLGGSMIGRAVIGPVAAINYGSISNSYATGSVAGSSAYVGGLVGSNSGSVSNSYASGSVAGTDQVGGLIGGDNSGLVSNSYATGNVTASTGAAGGLVGYSGSSATISNSHASGTVTGVFYVGGLLGSMNGSTVTNSYATGAVTGPDQVGGLIGGAANGATVSNSYATGAVSGNNSVGGLMGASANAITISTSYATGAVTGNTAVGALVGSNAGTVTNSYWNSTVNGALAGIGGGTTTGATGLTTVQMQTASNFAGFTFTTAAGATGNSWVMVDVDGTLNNAGGSLGATRPMLASEYSTTIKNTHELQLMAMNLSAKYTQAQNINAAATGNSSDVWGSTGFSSVGTFTSNFSGTFDGMGYTISNLTVNPGATRMFVGLFGGVSGTLKNVGLVDEHVTGNYGVGGLAGYLSASGSISNSYTTGAVAGSNIVGGLVGRAHGSISDSYSEAATSGDYTNGGLVGKNYGTVSGSFATGAVTGSQYNGGLVGINQGTIRNSYAVGSVTGTAGSRHWSGGLVGINYNTISNSYSAGAVAGTTDTFGGLVGKNYGNVSNSFWDTTTSGQAASAGGLGMTTAQMQSPANFTSATAANGNVNPAWDLTNTWIVYDGHTAPLLRSFMTSLTVTANSAAKTYDGAAYTGGNGVTYSTTPNGNLLGTASYGGSAQGATNAGSYAITAGGLYSTQHGYAITFIDGALLVDKANLTLSTANVTKTYDGGLSAAGTATVTGGTLFGSDTLSGGTFAFTDRNAGAGNKTVSATGVTVSDGNSGGNYNVSYVNNTTSTIEQAVLTAIATASNKIYDGTTSAVATLTIASGLVGMETVSVTGAAAFNSKDVATATGVTFSGTTLADGANGGLASNYRLADVQTAAATIAAKALTISGMTAADKTYDGNSAATLTGGTLNGLIGNETLSLSGQKGAFADKNVGAGKAVTVTGTALVDGTGLASNYSIANPTGLSAGITRLSSVAWVGGASGNWFDPANWAGGAVPDLANVANIVIPAGVTVSFDNASMVLPAQAGTVSLDSIGNGGSLSMVNGSLSVAAATRLASLDQSGGTFASGTIDVGSFSQSGGSLTSTGNFSVTNAYRQVASAASVNVGGNIGILQTSDTTTLGNITTEGSLDVTAVNGNITQLAGTSIAAQGGGTLSAPNGIVLLGDGNSIAGVTISDSRSSGGAGEALLQNALAGAIAVTGTTELASTTGTYVLAAPQPLPRGPSGASAANILDGLNVTLVAAGVKLPPGVQPDEANDGKQ